MSSQTKPGKLKSNLFINLNAMKPGAINPLIEKRRVSAHSMRNRNNSHNRYKNNSYTTRTRDDSKSEYKQHPNDIIANVIQSKLNQVTITAKRRKKGKRKSKKLLLSNDTHYNSFQPGAAYPQKTNVSAINNDPNGYVIIHTPPPPSPPHQQRPLQKLRISLVPSIKHTPFGHNNDVNAPSPVPPVLLTTPPPPPPPMPNNENRRNSAFIDVQKPPPPPLPKSLQTIDKAPRDTAVSTTFTVSGSKITIIGHARTGKTSLKNALFGKKFKDMTFPTVKAPPQPSIMIKPLSFNDNGECDVNVAYEIWDTPGQKVLEYIPPLYITGSFCVFIVYDLTDIFSYRRAKYWVNYLEENAKGYDNVVLIGNKYDLHEGERCIPSEEVQIYADKHDIFFIEISVKTKHNFDTLLDWLNHKTQERFQKEIAMEKEEPIEEKSSSAERLKSDKKGKEQKRLLKQHRRNNEAIHLDEIDYSRNKKKNKGCCLW